MWWPDEIALSSHFAYTGLLKRITTLISITELPPTMRCAAWRRRSRRGRKPGSAVLEADIRWSASGRDGQQHRRTATNRAYRRHGRMSAAGGRVALRPSFILPETDRPQAGCARGETERGRPLPEPEISF